jgi:fermentation-respiration switch protein FrsA (DUF1100 family)
MRTAWIGWTFAGASVYGVCSFLAGRAVYYPERYPAGWWDAQSEIGAKDVWLLTADGVKLHAWWVERAGSPVATLFLHGNAGNLSHRVPHARAIASAGSSVLLLDYRGYGKSAGRPTERGLMADADAGFQHLVGAGYRPERIVVHGESLGTAVAVPLAARKSPGGVILEAPFTSVADMAARVLPVLGPLLVGGFNSKTQIRNVRAPLLVIHGDRDETVPFSLGRALFDAANEPKSFWTIAGAGHNDIVEIAGARYEERLRAFYQSLMG